VQSSGTPSADALLTSNANQEISNRLKAFPEQSLRIDRKLL
jgi:hypothetical protein